jgi:RimJ/RimL family protein N-acetyltransferase
LVGSFVRLEPLSLDHVDRLVAAAGEDRSTYGFTVVPQGRDGVTTHVESLLRDHEAGLVVPFAQVDASGDLVVGMTRYLTIRARPGEDVPFAVEIGGTWLAASAQRSAINTESKFLLLRQAFEVWRVARVDFKTDSRNERSRAAITRLGAKFEGVLRHWQPSQVIGEEESYRDTAMFSVLDHEWAAVSLELTGMIKGRDASTQQSE